MGITDEDYAEAIKKQHRAQRQKAEEMLDVLGVGSYTTTTNTRGIKTLNEQDLHHEAMKVPLSALVDMWLARWQGEWVSETYFQEDDFWRITLVRLTGANKLEKHNLATQMSPVYRIIE